MDDFRTWSRFLLSYEPRGERSARSHAAIRVPRTRKGE